MNSVQTIIKVGGTSFEYTMEPPLGVIADMFHVRYCPEDFGMVGMMDNVGLCNECKQCWMNSLEAVNGQ